MIGALLTFEAFRQLATVQQPRISPDGKSVVYVRSRVDWQHDRYDTELVVVGVEGGTPRILTRDRISVGSPRWSPDGTRIAYLAAMQEHKPRQIYVLPMNGGDSERITDAPEGVLSFAWRPDGNALAYVAEDEPSNKNALEHHLDAVVVTDNDYLTTSAPLPAHLWEVDPDGRHATRLNSGSWSVVDNSQPVWSPDGQRIYYQRQPDPIFAHWVEQTTYAYDLRTKQDISSNTGVDADPDVSRDGKYLLIRRPRHGSLYLQNDAAVLSLAGDSVAFDTRAVDRNVHWQAFMPEDQIAIQTADAVRDVLWFVPHEGAPSKVDLGDVDFAPDATVGTDGAIAFVGMRADDPSNIYYLAPGSHQPRQLTDENPWLRNEQLARVTEVRWQIDNGMAADGVLTYPVGYVAGRKYPLVLDIHGGPVETSTWDMSGLEGGELAQLFAAGGYLVLRPNYRGSDNNGDAFLQAIVGDVTSGPGRDNLAGVAAVEKMGIVDESRIFVSGWSGGGLQTSWLIGHANIWRAAVSGAAVNDWYQQAVLADINESFGAAFFNGLLPFTAQGRAQYRAESPITYVDAVKTPTLILSDTRDPRVPVSQAYTFYHALRDRGVPVRFVAFPRYGHFPADPVGRERVLRAWVGWIQQWSK